MRKATAIILTFTGFALTSHSGAFFWGMRYTYHSYSESVLLCKAEGDALGASTFILDGQCWITNGTRSIPLDQFKLQTLTENKPGVQS